MEDNAPIAHHPFYKNIWFWTTSFLLFIIVAGFAFLWKHHLLESAKQSNVSSSPVETTQAELPITSSNQPSQVDQKPSYKYGDAYVTQLVNNALASGKVVKALAHGDPLHPKGMGVIIGNKLMAVLDGYRLKTEFYPYRNYLVVDFEVFNLSLDPYYSLITNFTLVDNNGLEYNYSPSFGTSTIGDIGGKVEFNNIRRGEIAFEIPVNGNPINNPNYRLKFDTGLNAPSYVEFSINLNKAEK